MSEEPNEAVAAYMNSTRRIGPDGTETFIDPLYGAHLANELEGFRPLTGKEVAAWTRSHRPDLWVTEPAKATPAPETAKATQKAAEPAPTRRMGPDPFKHSQYFTAKPGSLSDLMAKAKAGDAQAMAALKSQMGIA